VTTCVTPKRRVSAASATGILLARRIPWFKLYSLIWDVDSRFVLRLRKKLPARYLQRRSSDPYTSDAVQRLDSSGEYGCRVCGEVDFVFQALVIVFHVTSSLPHSS
jgi:hypothetical protein